MQSLPPAGNLVQHQQSDVSLKLLLHERESRGLDMIAPFVGLCQAFPHVHSRNARINGYSVVESAKTENRAIRRGLSKLTTGYWQLTSSFTPAPSS